MLMASTSACYKLFREKQKEGHGEAIMFKGECPPGPGREQGAEPTETLRRTGQMNTSLLSTQLCFPGRLARSRAVSVVGSNLSLL